jgi:hypothetical protein
MPDVDDPDIPKQAESGTLDEDDSKTVAQQNVGKDNVAGGGEWPDPDTPPRGPAPGVAATQVGVESPSSEPQFKDVLEENPVSGGSSSVPDED